MLKTREETRTVKVADKMVCDRCGKEIDPDDFVEWQEALIISFTGGFGSVFGDGTRCHLDLCQECVKKVLGPYIRRDGDDEDPA